MCMDVCVCVSQCVCAVYGCVHIWVDAFFYRTVAVCVLYGCVCVSLCVCRMWTSVWLCVLYGHVCVCVQDVDKCVAVCII